MSVSVANAWVDAVAAAGEAAAAWHVSGRSADDLRRCEALPDALADAASRLQEHLPLPERQGGVVKYSGLLTDLVPSDPTPPRWGEPQSDAVAIFDVALTLVALALGSPFGWQEQQQGRLVHDIVPTRGTETMQVGSSSSAPLEWHTEDSFHPDRAHLILLACVRNPASIGSLAASVRHLGLTPEDLDVLARPEVAIRADDSYGGQDDGGDQTGVATIWQATDGPCLKYDPAYSVFLSEDQEFRRAYEGLGEAVRQSAVKVPLEPGDVLVMDNDLVVHARESFEARFDGTDRWLKRVLVDCHRKRPEAERLAGLFGQVILRAPGLETSRRASGDLA